MSHRSCPGGLQKRLTIPAKFAEVISLNQRFVIQGMYQWENFIPKTYLLYCVAFGLSKGFLFC